MVPLKINGVCGIIDILLLSDLNPIFLASQPPINNPDYYVLSYILNNDCIILDFPDPLLPTRATFYPGLIVRFIEFKAGSRF